MHEVQLRIAGHPVDGHRQGQGIRGVLEERVVLHLHFVKEDALVEPVETEGQRVRHEVHLVPPLGEGEPEFGRDRARTAVRGITGDSDLHGVSSPRRLRHSSMMRATRSSSASRSAGGVSASITMASSGS